jgi:hypothetical protein
MNASANEETPATGTFRLTVTPWTDYYGPGDARARDEEFELQQALKQELPDHVRMRSAEGEKGVITDIIVPLGTSGALTAVVELFKAWLSKRPTNRRITVDFEVEQNKKGRRSGSLTVDATNVDNEILDTVARAALEAGK